MFLVENAQNGVERSEVQPLGETQRSGTEWALISFIPPLFSRSGLSLYTLFYHWPSRRTERNGNGAERSGNEVQ
ncbi:hypothetical protein [Allomuricauda sp. M10]|uniref:hypothetical protein n=1 Tax=Allomuricauda sp. M10 TaxID=2683292 RepID=UPI001D189E51|nr:hypothetical protein [Muricauda sp. M10]